MLDVICLFLTYTDICPPPISHPQRRDNRVQPDDKVQITLAAGARPCETETIQVGFFPTKRFHHVKVHQTNTEQRLA